MRLLATILEFGFFLLLTIALVAKYVYKIDTHHYHMRQVAFVICVAAILSRIYLFIRREFFPEKEQPANPE